MFFTSLLKGQNTSSILEMPHCVNHTSSIWHLFVFIVIMGQTSCKSLCWTDSRVDLHWIWCLSPCLIMWTNPIYKSSTIYWCPPFHRDPARSWCKFSWCAWCFFQVCYPREQWSPLLQWTLQWETWLHSLGDPRRPSGIQIFHRCCVFV